MNISNIKAIKRIGPHNINILSILIGSLLGDGHMEKDKKGLGTRFAFYQEKSNPEYLLYLHNKISSLGYAKYEIPQIHSKLNNKKEFRYYYRFRTFTYTSFNWIYESFYKLDLYDNKLRKIVPYELLKEYFNYEILAIWLQDDGSIYKNKGIKFSTNSFTLKEIKSLILILECKFNIKSTIHKTGVINQYNIYIPKKYISNLIPKLLPYIHPSMYYKLGVWFT